MKNFLKKSIKNLSDTRQLSFLWKFPNRIVDFIQRANHKVVVSYDDPERSKVIDLIFSIQKESQVYLFTNEGYQIYMAVRKTEKILGDIAEVGCFKGGSTKIICEAKGNKTLHVFDTFDGLPDLTPDDDEKRFHKGQYSSSIESVKHYLKQYDNVNFYKGFFPSTAGPVKDLNFSFVHLDVDLYKTTLEGIKFFYPRMSKGGVMISHDYIDTPGVKKAFDEFFLDMPVPVIEMSGTQCMVIKLE